MTIDWRGDTIQMPAETECAILIRDVELELPPTPNVMAASE